jgi:hypothetical protein
MTNMKHTLWVVTRCGDLCYNDHLMNNYLDFVENDRAIKIAYSASFGVDQWEADEATTRQVAELAKLFNAISVREQSGIHLCKEHLGVEACSSS